jgi:DNA-binding transcriptional LysR family regulator
MNLNQLRFAGAVARLGSFSKAAAACHVTQPTLSSAVVQLEERLGGRLFERTTRAVALTAFGRHLMPAIENILASLTELERSRDAYLRPRVKLARIGLSQVVDMARLVQILEPFKSAHSDTEIIYKECVLDDLEQRLLSEQIDVAIWPKQDNLSAALTHLELYRDPLMFLPRGDRAGEPRGRAAVPIAELAGETFVMSAGLCGLAQTTAKLFEEHAVRIAAYPGRAMSYRMLEEWADLGIGAAVLPASKLSTGRAAQARPIAVGKKGGRGVMTMVASWKTSAGLPPHIKALRRYLTNR